MREHASASPTTFCEKILVEDRTRNVDLQIVPSENKVIDRLLERRVELVDAYAEIYKKLGGRQNSVLYLLDLIITTAAYWHPDQMSQARRDRARLEQVNRDIAEQASALAALLEERSDLHNSSGFTSDTHYHIAKVIQAAAAQNGHYRLYLDKELQALYSRFSLKYWPNISEILQVIAADAADPEVMPTDPLTAAGTAGLRASRADFFQALLVRLDEGCESNGGLLPRGFKLSNDALASFANCALGLPPEDLVDAAYVKRLKQRSRELRKPT